MIVTHILDTSAALTQMLDEPGADIVDSILLDPANQVAVSVLTLFEVWTAYRDRTGSHDRAEEAVTNLRLSVSGVLPVTEAIVELAFELRRAASARVALADCLIAATATHHGAILVHRDPHFAVLPVGRPGAGETTGQELSRSIVNVSGQGNAKCGAVDRTGATDFRASNIFGVP